MKHTLRSYLIQCLAEEAVEIAHSASKCLRFGDDNQWPGYEGTALERLAGEINDFKAVLEMLQNPHHATIRH